MHKNQVTWKVFLLILLNDGVNTVAQLLMKKGLAVPAKNLGSLHSLADFICANSSSLMMWAGIVIYALSFFIWIAVLSRIDLSVAMPMASTDYVMIPLFAMLFLKEQVSLLRWTGILAIVLGIYIVSRSGRQTAPAGRQP